MVRPIVQMRPNRCKYCDVGYAALGYTLEEAVKRGYDVTDLGGDLATREDLERIIAEKAPLFFHAFGHGNETTFTGQDTEPVITKGVNEGVLVGMITYLLSCLTGVELGPAIIDAGGWSYIGYTVKWTWIDEDGAGDPFEDRYAEGFYDSSNIIPIAVLNGLTTNEAYQAGYDKYTEWIDYWSASDDPYASECVHWLTHDRDNCILFGDPAAKIEVITHRLTLNSSPSGFEIWIDNIRKVVAPATTDLMEGVHTLSVEPQWINGVPYGLDRWEDGSTYPIREINLTADMTVTAYIKELPSHLLNVNSEPVSGVPFTLNDEERTTPLSETLLEGIHMVSMPDRIEAGGVDYRFLNWEDGGTDPVRAINLTADMTVTAYYIALHTLELHSEPTLGVTLTLDGIEYITRAFGIGLDEGDHTIIAPESFVANGATYTFVRWEDGTTTPTRTVTVVSDMKVVAYYEGRGSTPLTATLTAGLHTISVPEFIEVP